MIIHARRSRHYPEAILNGCPAALDIAPREKAIQQAIAELNGDDTLLIAGKGHENGQTIGTEILPFDDASVARHALMNLAGTNASIEAHDAVAAVTATSR